MVGMVNQPHTQKKVLEVNKKMNKGKVFGISLITVLMIIIVLGQIAQYKANKICEQNQLTLISHEYNLLKGTTPTQVTCQGIARDACITDNKTQYTWCLTQTLITNPQKK